MTMEGLAALGAAATVPHQPVHLHIGRLVVDADLMRAFSGDKAALVIQLQADIAARLDARPGVAVSVEPTGRQADRRADLVGPIGAAVASHVLPHLRSNGGQ